MSPTSRYLKSATRGLWGRQRRELRRELLGHIQVRVQELRLGGLSEAEAERQTLRELGAPGEVSGGMLSVHTLPVAFKGSVVSALLATFFVSTLPQGLAQVQSIFGYVDKVGAASYLDFTQLQQELGKVGGTLSGPPENATLRLSSTSGVAQLHPWAGTILKQDGRTYIRADDFVQALRDTHADLRLSGWTNPTLFAGKSLIQLQTEDWRVINTLYKATLDSNQFYQGHEWALVPLEPNGNTQQRSFKGGFRNGQVYAVVTPEFNEWAFFDAQGKEHRHSVLLKFNSNVAQDGAVSFRFNGAYPVKLYSSVASFWSAVIDLEKVGAERTWSTQNPCPALLISLSGHFGPDAYTVVPPDEVRPMGEQH